MKKGYKICMGIYNKNSICDKCGWEKKSYVGTSTRYCYKHTMINKEEE